MHTLNDNYKRNIEILRENLRRGLTQAQANKVIAGMQSQFMHAGLYNEEAQQFISEMRQAVNDQFIVKISAVDAMAQLGVEVVRIS